MGKIYEQVTVEEEIERDNKQMKRLLTSLIIYESKEPMRFYFKPSQSNTL